ncbi:hypothetical protein AKO1_009097 [Acrasis kona]|uniref:C2 NT-type domain-containing protein n=1 Tax=Acrasis kona TaxID=1008807 RepID=A0AAW2ZGG2_9EUKA
MLGTRFPWNKTKGTKQKLLFQVKVESIEKIPMWYQPAIAVEFKINKVETIGRTKFKTVVSGGHIIYKQTFEFEAVLNVDEYGTYEHKRIAVQVLKQVGSKIETVCKSHLDLSEIIVVENEKVSKDLEIFVHDGVCGDLLLTCLCITGDMLQGVNIPSLERDSDNLKTSPPTTPSAPSQELEVTSSPTTFNSTSSPIITTPSDPASNPFAQIAQRKMSRTINVEASPPVLQRSNSANEEITLLRMELERAKKRIAELEIENEVLKRQGSIKQGSSSAVFDFF